jgi:hypothetical protein
VAGNVAYMEEDNKVYKISVRKLEGKRPLWRQRHGWEGGIKVHLREISREGVKWIHLSQDKAWWWALVNMVMNLHVLAPCN